MAINTSTEWTDATWHEKTAAARIGITPEEYVARIAIGEKWCTSCKAWHSRWIFPADRSRSDGLAASCRGYRPSRPTDSAEERRAKEREQYRSYYAGKGGAGIRAQKGARKRKCGPVRPFDRELVYESFFGVCAYCGIRAATTIDHAIPIKSGGSSKRGNLIAACQSCNSRKKTKALDVFLEECIAAGYTPSDRILEELCMEDVL